MTVEKNGIQTGEYEWNGNPKYRFIPDYEELLANATCEEEAEAIREAERIMTEGFTFEIVFTMRAMSYDFRTGKGQMKWQVMQHPWYRSYDGVYDSKETMIRQINELAEEYKRKHPDWI